MTPPTMPITAVPMNFPGSFPGRIAFAITPAMRPNRIQLKAASIFPSIMSYERPQFEAIVVGSVEMAQADWARHWANLRMQLRIPNGAGLATRLYTRHRASDVA